VTAGSRAKMVASLIWSDPVATQLLMRDSGRAARTQRLQGFDRYSGRPPGNLSSGGAPDDSACLKVSPRPRLCASRRSHFALISRLFSCPSNGPRGCLAIWPSYPLGGVSRVPRDTWSSPPSGGTLKSFPLGPSEGSPERAALCVSAVFTGGGNCARERGGWPPVLRAPVQGALRLFRWSAVAGGVASLDLPAARARGERSEPRQPGRRFINGTHNG